MSNKPLITLFLLMALMAFTACSDSNSDSVKSLRIDAENALRNGKYQKAYSICSDIVAKDSTVSFGYFCMAKAGLLDKDINPLEILSLLETEDEYEIPFAKENAYIKTKYLQGMKVAWQALTPLRNRDTLTRDNPGSAPLTDSEYGGDYIGDHLFITTSIKGILEVYDNNGDGCIIRNGDSTLTGDYDWKKLGCDDKLKFFDICVDLKKKVGEDGFDVELCGNIFDDLGLDDDWYRNQEKDTPLPQGIKDMNSKMDNFSGDMEEVLSIMGSLGMGGNSGSWTADLETYKEYAAFYRIGTRIDETGDGCIEAQLLDGQDNLGEGLKNASARIASTDSLSPLWGRAGINHSMRGEVEGPSDINHQRNKPMLIKAPAFIRNKKGVNCNANPADCTMLPGDSTGTGYATVIRFTQEKYANGTDYWTSKNLAMKLEVAKDTVCPPKYSLAMRQELIGGCWPNYDEAKFRKYWLKRGLARPEDQYRIHPTCRDY